jgi:hypothetical protein
MGASRNTGKIVLLCGWVFFFKFCIMHMPDKIWNKLTLKNRIFGKFLCYIERVIIRKRTNWQKG